MVALRIFPESSSQQVINGAQLIEIIGRAEDFQENIKRNATAEELNISKNTKPEAPKSEEPESEENDASPNQTVQPQAQ
jgi:hypothetical protein